MTAEVAMNGKSLKQKTREMHEHSAVHLQNQLDYFSYKTDALLLNASDALEMAKTLFNHSMEGVILTDRNTRIQRINQTFTEVTGYTLDKVIGKTPAVLQSGQHGKDFYKDMWESLKKKGKWQRQIFNRKKNGEVYPEWLKIYAIKNENSTLINYLGMFTDLTNKVLAKDTIHHLAYYDPLTNLPNRLLFSERLKQNILIAKRKKSSFALFFIDLDGFKKINDSLGHDVGDILLQEVALRLKRPLRESDTVSRLGGDEFTIILDGVVECRNNGYQVSAVVVDRSGNLQASLRDVYASRFTTEIALRKANTVILSGIDSGVFRKSREDIRQELNHIDGIIVMEGGIPVESGGTLLGAIGVSGAPGGDKDAVCAKAALKSVEQRLIFAGEE